MRDTNWHSAKFIISKVKSSHLQKNVVYGEIKETSEADTQPNVRFGGGEYIIRPDSR